MASLEVVVFRILDATSLIIMAFYRLGLISPQTLDFQICNLAIPSFCLLQLASMGTCDYCLVHLSTWFVYQISVLICSLILFLLHFSHCDSKAYILLAFLSHESFTLVLWFDKPVIKCNAINKANICVYMCEHRHMMKEQKEWKNIV